MIDSVRRCWSTGARVVSLLALSTSWVHASGFAIDNQGTRAMGFAGAYVAQASDPSAIFYNAAGVAFLKGQQIYVSGGLGSYATSFTGEGPNPPAGTLEESDRLLTILPSFYYTHQVSSNLVLGLGFNAPFGARSVWKNPNEFTGRYICTDCEIRSWGLNPTLAYKLEDRLAVGIGLDVRFSSFRLSQRLLANPNPFPIPTDVASLHRQERHRHGHWVQRRAPGEPLGVRVDRPRLPAQGAGELRRHGRTSTRSSPATRSVDAAVAAQPASQPGGDGGPRVSLELHGRTRGPPRLLDDRGRPRLDVLVELRPRRPVVPGAPRPSPSVCRRTTRAPGRGGSASSTC